MAGGSVDFGQLVQLAERVAERLKARGETLAIAESSAGGLISAALLAIPGASAYFVGGAVVYTRVAKQAALHLSDADIDSIRPSTEGHALILARGARAVHGTTWALGETGATGPTGNRYGDAAGHACIAVVGPTERAITIETASDDRQANMDAFAQAGLRLLDELVAARD
jgi:nicotinamide-nucleotide amidase